MKSSLIFIVYTILIALGLYHHEMWRDELQAWNIVLKSNSIFDLFYNIRYEGHPVLWFLIIWPFSKFTSSPYLIQIIHFCFSVLSAYLIVFKSPLSTLEKIAVLFSYFLFFEYALISRNYIIGVFLMLCIAYCWKNYRLNILPIGILLFLLFQCSAFMTLIAAAILLILIIRLYFDHAVFLVKNIAAICLGLAGGILFLYTTFPQADSSYATIWNLHFWPGLFISVMAKMNMGLLPVPIFKTAFWETRIIQNDIINGIIGITIWLALLWIWRKNIIIFVFLLSSFGLIALFLYLKPLGGMRHYGHLSLALIFVYWISYYDNYQPQKVKFLFRFIFLLQVCIGLFAAFEDWNHPFSNAKNVAAFIKKKLPADVQIAGAYNNLSTAIAGYLGKDIYFLNDGRYSNYVIWREKYWNEAIRNLSEKELLTRYVSTFDIQKSNVLIMSYTGDYSSDSSRFREGESKLINLGSNIYKVTCLKVFGDAIAADENYFLYSISFSE